jgi:hypothetical protein
MVLVKILASTQMGQKLSYNLQGKLPESQLSENFVCKVGPAKWDHFEIERN